MFNNKFKNLPFKKFKCSSFYVRSSKKMAVTALKLTFTLTF